MTKGTIGISHPELQVMLQTIGLTALPDLPLIDLNQTSGWQVFRKTIQSLWVSLRVACITQRNLTRAELIRTCVQWRCDLMKSNQGQMIWNLLEQQRCTIKLDKVVKIVPGSGLQVIDEPAAVLAEVRRYFQQWTAKRQVQPLSG